jgi:hypothetical protein
MFRLIWLSSRRAAWCCDDDGRHRFLPPAGDWLLSESVAVDTMANSKLAAESGGYYYLLVYR